MIEKETGNPSIHHLRVIHLYEIDYILILRIKFRELLHKCLDNGCIHDGCFGSLAHRQSRDLVFLEVMNYDYSQLILLHFRETVF